ncbi:MAG: C-terminal binding protein [Symploca sp. SIO3C6]|uniref:C-terminal binding protein n=1 Tax=Symploca sp. SIO1C4 TaxID=2607765 RepID=A0A6B3NIF6_9CYAN|nr:C-terminal binding protein [Symploca sp. SIO3C6]NER30655.1 C-terminal binding protein [Symploca sp. SIO1C4]NET08046.1 C-terminal binding protein [Symploca sp. SIO2B6]
MSKVYITDRINDPVIERKFLKENLTLQPSPDVVVLLVWHEFVDANYLSKFPNLKAIIRYGVGFDNIDLDACRARGIKVCNTPDYCTEEVSTSAVAMILNATRGISRYDYLARNFKQGWQENILSYIHRGSTQMIGFIGVGRIGGLTLNRCKLLGFDTQYYDPYSKSGDDCFLGSKCVSDLETFLATSDVVSLHCPLTNNTQGMVDQNFVLKMKQGSSLINTARGKLIANLDVIESALRENHLNVVALDVLPLEPPGEHRLIQAWRRGESWIAGRLIINPHVAFYSQQSSVEQRHNVASNALRVLQGLNPINIVT